MIAIASVLPALIRRMLDDLALGKRARVNLVKQFAESSDFGEIIADALPDNQGGNTKVADYFSSDVPYRPVLILASAKAFHEFAEVDIA